MIAENSNKETNILSGFYAQVILLVLLTLISFFPAINAGFIWDDSGVTENTLLFNLDGLLKIWTAPSLLPHEAHYWPVVYTSFWIDYQIWGLNPLGYHLVNILIHVLNVILLFIIVRRLYAPAAWLAAAIFAFHPLHVESVAWIIERKDVLSTAFFLLSFLLFMLHIEKRKLIYYLIAIFVFIPAMLTKSMTACLPVALLLWLWWRSGANSEKPAVRHYFSTVPFFVIALVIGAADSIYARHSHPVNLDLAFTEKIIIAGKAFWFYLWKFIRPLNLIPIYPRWEVNTANAMQYFPLLGALLFLVLLWIFRRRVGRGVAALFLFYAAALAPVSGIIEHHFMVHSFVADRFFYLPGIALIIFVAVLLRIALTAGDSLKRYAYPAVSVLLVIILASLTWKQSALYKNMETLFTYNIEINPTAWAAYNNLGVYAMEHGDYSKAESNFRKAAGLKPDNEDAFINLGFLESEQGRPEEALDFLTKALKINPENPKTHNNIGIIYSGLSELDSAEKHLRKAVQLKPGYADAWSNLGNILKFSGKYSEAIEMYRQAVSINPNFAEPYYNLGVIFAEQGNADEAVGYYRDACRIDPDYADAFFNLGLIYARQGKIPEAEESLARVLEIDPGFIKARLNLAQIYRLQKRMDKAEVLLLQGFSGNPGSAWLYNGLAHVYEDQGKISEAYEAYKKALKAAPDWVEPADRLAWIMSDDSSGEFHNPQKAVRLSEDICLATKYQNPVYLKTLARAYASSGRMDDAVSTVEQAIALLQNYTTNNETLLSELHALLDSYKNR